MKNSNTRLNIILGLKSGKSIGILEKEFGMSSDTIFHLKKTYEPVDDILELLLYRNSIQKKAINNLVICICLISE